MNQQKVSLIFQRVMLRYDENELTNKQMARMHYDIERVCKLFRDGYDRARALELEYKWTKIDAKLVAILHEE